MQTEEKAPSFFKEKKRIYYLVAIVLGLFVAGLWWWRAYIYPFESTEDAYIDGVNLSISSVQAGQILKMAVDEGSVVKPGDLLFVMDEALLRVGKEKAVAGLAHARDEALAQRIRLDLARDEFERAKLEFDAGVISQEMMERIVRNLQLAEAGLLSITSVAAVQEAELKFIETQMGMSRIVAPMHGVVAKRWHTAGDVVREGQTVLSLIDLSDIWVSANIEETKLPSIRTGDLVEISIDAYPHLEFQGQVMVIGAAAASQFALIPSNNGSGNFTKVTQRVPLKISLTSSENRAELYLRPGMSVKVKIRAR